MKYLIAGLGNVGDEYTGTRHNVGFDALEKLALDLGLQWNPGRFGMLASGKFRGRQVYLLKPDTYMNLSGRAVLFWQKQLGIPLDQVLIITDDLNLPLGKVRLKMQGSSGGHNGLRSIEDELGSSGYPRIRVGIGRDFSAGRQIDFVLGKWTEEEMKLLPPVLAAVSEAARDFTFLSVGPIMSKLNGLNLGNPA